MGNKIDLQTNLIKSNLYLGACKDPQFGRALEYLPAKPSWFSRLIGWFKGSHPSSNLDRVIATASKIAQEALSSPECNNKQILILQRNLAFLHAKALKHNNHWFVKLISCITKRVLCNSETLLKIEEQIHQLENKKGKSEGDSKKARPSPEAPNFVEPDKVSPVITVTTVIKDEIDTETEQANLIVNSLKKAGALSKIVTKLVTKGDFDQAFKVALLIPETSVFSDYDQYTVIKKGIVDELLSRGNFDKAIEVTLKIPNKDYKARILKHLAKYEIKKGGIEKSIEISKIMPEGGCKSGVLSRIGKFYASQGNIDKSFEIAHEIPNEDYKDSIFLKIIKELLLKGDINKAIETAKIIISYYNKRDALEIIIKAINGSGEEEYKKAQQLELLVELIDGLPAYAKSVLYDLIPQDVVFSARIKKGNFVKAVEIAKKLKSNFEKVKACKVIMKALTEKGHTTQSLNVATELFKNVEDEVSKNDCMSQVIKSGIVNVLIKKGKADEAIDIAKMISTEYIRCRAYKSIVKKGLIPQGNDKLAKVVANEISNEPMKVKVFWHINQMHPLPKSY